ncbi:hypothetical protein [Bradyrhizobium sp. ARR65]|nr:hypothetical protein [Bradyrhizobium sp. ARR65]
MDFFFFFLQMALILPAATCAGSPHIGTAEGLNIFSIISTASLR